MQSEKQEGERNGWIFGVSCKCSTKDENAVGGSKADRRMCTGAVDEHSGALCSEPRDRPDDTGRRSWGQDEQRGLRRYGGFISVSEPLAQVHPSLRGVGRPHVLHV